MKLFAALAALFVALVSAARSEPGVSTFSETAEVREISPVAKSRFKENYAAAFAAPLRWQIDGLNSGGISGNFNLSRDYALIINFEGTFSDIFKDYVASAGAAWNSREGIRLALLAEARTSQIINYGTETIACANLAAAIELTESIEISSTITNINGAHYKGGERAVRRTAAFGANFSALDELSLEAETIIEIDRETIGRAGAAWRASDIIAFRANYATDGELQFGTKLNPFEDLILELNFERRPRLGVGSGVLIGYAWR